jgi:hypothetical protein
MIAGQADKPLISALGRDEIRGHARRPFLKRPCTPRRLMRRAINCDRPELHCLVERQKSKEDDMRYKPKSTTALQIVLGGLDQMPVKVEPGIGLSAKTVGELRQASTWPGNLAIAMPQQLDPEGTVRVEKLSSATRVTPKP